MTIGIGAAIREAVQAMAIQRIQVVAFGPEGQRLAHYTLLPGEYFIGRSSACRILLDDPKVSRRHARLAVGDKQVLIEDLGSTQGTFLGGAQVTAPIPLDLPTEIRVGDIRLEVHSGAEALSELDTAHLLQGPKYMMGVSIAQGGMGVVFNAEDIKLRRPVAMKRLLARGASSPDKVRRFVREAQVLGMLEHPNIVPIHELGRDEQGEVFYTMKFVQGRTLHAVLSSLKSGTPEDIANYPLNRLLTIFQKICDAVAFAHSKGVIHRDLKPANIMIGDYGEVLVLDWGLAKILYADAEEGIAVADSPSPAMPALDLTMPGDIMGTPNFMAPEQAAGRIERQDERTDIFALGGILYSILTLHAPVLGATVGELLAKIQKGQIPPPVYYNRPREMEVNGERQVEAPNLPHCPGGQVPESLSAVAMKALAVKAEQRYQTVADLQKDLEAYRTGYATAAEEASVGKHLWLLVKRRKVEFGLVAAATMVIVALAIGSFLRINTEKRQAQDALGRLQATAPSLRDLALSLVEAKKFPEALQKIDDALKLKPEEAEYHNLRGQLCQTLFRFKDSHEAFARAVKLNPRQPFAAENLKLCEKMMPAAPETNAPSSDLLEELRQAMLQQGRAAEAIFLGGRLGVGKQQSLEAWSAKLATVTGAKPNLLRSPEGFFELSISHNSLTDLSVLKDMPLRVLSLQGCSQLSDLGPLAGMALTHLRINQTKVTDLTPLKGMPLTYLNACESPLRDLRPLKGLPLTEVLLAGTAVVDLGPLRDSPVTSLTLNYSTISDLGPLKGMPIKHLQFYQTSVRDMTPLKGLPLEYLVLSQTLVADLTPIQGMPLSFVNAASTRITNLEPLRGMLLTELEIGATKVSNLDPLRECVHLKGLGIRDCPGIQDLQPLTGLPLKALVARGTKISNLTPLIGMKLENLEMCVCPVSDIEPLRGMPLAYLNLFQTKITNISVLAEMPLLSLRLDGSTSLKDVSPLANCRQLEHLSIPVTATNIEFLRDFPKLKRLGYAVRDDNWETCLTPAEFWKAYDARKKPTR